MWNTITDFLLKAHAYGLGHDAVIEIMIALLGIMVAVLSLFAVLVSILLGVLGFIGYGTIKGAAKKKAEELRSQNTS